MSTKLPRTYPCLEAKMNEPEWTVGRVAKRCGVNVSTLHFYEKRGLIKSWRSAGNQRRYKADVLRRVSVIKAAQRMGITLESIREACHKSAHRPFRTGSCCPGSGRTSSMPELTT